MIDRCDDLLDDLLERACDRAEWYAGWVGRSRSRDPAFAEASALYPPDMSDWHAAVYVLSGNDGVWSEVGAVVMSERPIKSVVEELERPRRPWASGEDPVLRCATRFCDVDRWPATFPYVFERFLFYRWLTVRRLRQWVPPALTITKAR